MQLFPTVKNRLKPKCSILAALVPCVLSLVLPMSLSFSALGSQWDHAVMARYSSHDPLKQMSGPPLNFNPGFNFSLDFNSPNVTLGTTTTLDGKIFRAPLLYDAIPILGADVVWEGQIENPSWFAHDVPSVLSVCHGLDSHGGLVPF